MSGLWHFTCEHAAASIDRSGILLPNPHPLLPEIGPVVWLTNWRTAGRDALGLTSETLTCDRMEVCYSVIAPLAVPWAWVRDDLDPEAVAALERFSRPETWRLSLVPVSASRERVPA